jgi:protein tyrosine phosphatase type 4A
MTDPKNNGGNTANNSNNMSNTISSKPTLITTPHLRFLIMDAPRQSNLHLYIKECRRHHVTDVVRVCEPTYLGAELNSAGIALHEMAYEDGHSPSEDILKMWLDLVEERFFGSAITATTGGAAKNENTIAVHCVAGLGRAPVLVAIALMEFEKMDAVDAVTMIRKGRRGAINEKQLQYLEGYKCRRRGARNGCGCVIL